MSGSEDTFDRGLFGRSPPNILWKISAKHLAAKKLIDLIGSTLNSVFKKIRKYTDNDMISPTFKYLGNFSY